MFLLSNLYFVPSKGHLAALFNGIRQRDTGGATHGGRSAHTREFSDYRISLGSDVSLDIPDKWASLNKARTPSINKDIFKVQNREPFFPFYHHTEY